MTDLNWLAVVAAAVSAFVLGGIWYGPLFKHAWCREAGIDPNARPGHPGRVFGSAFVLALVAAIAFAWWLGPRPALDDALCRLLLAGAGLVATCFGSNSVRSAQVLSTGSANKYVIGRLHA
jgi:hypothetical protein